MIQVIKYKDYPKITTSNDIVVKNFKNYMSFDLYDINIICLNDLDMWKYTGNAFNNVSCANDICKLKKSINTSKSKCIIILPVNGSFEYAYYSGYTRSIDLKNMLSSLRNIILEYIYDFIPCFEYEPGISTVNGIKYNYDFYFETSSKNILIRGDKNDKVVAYGKDNVTVTTLQLGFKDGIEESLNNLVAELYKEEAEFVPEWIYDISFYDDNKYIDSNKKINEKISEMVEKINKNNLHLDINNHFKSILYESGNKLQDVVIEIIENITGKHNDFEDVSEEDYLFKSNDYTFIVETKGLNGEVQGKHVNAAIAHLTIYEDNLEQQGIEENTKCLFIVASERLKRVDDRSQIKDRNITIAKRNNALIIDTPTLLNVYEDFLYNKIDKDEIINIFINQSGLIKYESKV